MFWSDFSICYAYIVILGFYIITKEIQENVVVESLVHILD